MNFFTETEINVLKNFAKINPSMIIHPDRFEVISNSNSIVGKYQFEEAYNFESYGIYEIPTFLQAIETFAKPQIEVKDKAISIKDAESNAKIKFFTTPIDILPKVPDIDPKYEKVDKQLQFSLPADKLAAMFKTAQILRSEYVYFESDGDNVRITVTTDINSSENSFEITIRDNVQASDLGDEQVRIPMAELRIIPGDYDVSISASGISKWECFNGVNYYIGCRKV